MDVNHTPNNYIKGLDGLRGVAAIVVILGHVELIKKTFDIPNVYDGGGPFFLYLGSFAVTFFFVLSGFLITYLLLKEREAKKKISIKNFYLRRLLRIWPVYYLLFIAGFVILPLIANINFILPTPIPQENYWRSFIFNLLLLPNFVKPSNPIAFQSWSIGVEEQFYIFWPLIISRIVSIRKLLLTMVLIIIGIYLLRATVYLNSSFSLNYLIFEKINTFFAECRFDNMATGGILAVVFFKRPSVVIPVALKVLVIVVLSYFLIAMPTIGFGLDHIVAAIIFATLISVVIYEKDIRFLEHRIFKFFGKISYGLYMYHVIGTVLAINFFKYFVPNFEGTGIRNVILHILAVIFTIIISNVSFSYMERYFLKFKK